MEKLKKPILITEELHNILYIKKAQMKFKSFEMLINYLLDIENKYNELIKENETEVIIKE